MLARKELKYKRKCVTYQLVLKRFAHLVFSTPVPRLPHDEPHDVIYICHVD